MEFYTWGRDLSLRSVVLHVMHRRTVSDARVPCAKSTRDDLRALKRGDIVTYDELFQRMMEQYDPEQAAEAVEE